ncbi:DUF4998 domain-containing protein [Sphingobacterium sp. LRF_L2]|uniref:DUF4998 domain-containing protein n=1 Tax=Sphingobacterium sp. LRF_L2 TaxID=3369421 RepID=UPI003F6073E5
MDKHLIKRLFRIIVPCLVVYCLVSCSKSDDYKKYLEGGEITYTGKIDSVTVYSGKERVYVTGLFLADPKIEKLRVYWGNRTDSVDVAIQRTENVDTLKLIIPVEEGVHNFEFVTFDGLGNKSLTVYKTGVSYGARYSSGLINRPVSNSYISEGDEGWIEWGGMDLTSGVIATEVSYTDENAAEHRFLVPIDSTASLLPEDYVIGESVKYRTLFRPDTLSIDTFYTEYTELNFTRYVTALYLTNTTAPFATSASTGVRWATPANWVTNSAVKNYLSNGVYYGGVDLNQNSRLTMESGWNSTNLLSFTNGKIYQTTILPAGNYEYEVDIDDASSSGSFYIVVAKGTSIPNIESLSSEAFKYLSFVNRTGTLSLSFELTEETELSFGFVGSLVGTGSTGQYWKANSVKLKYLAQ